MKKAVNATIYPFTITPNGAVTIPCSGAYFKIRSATGAVSVQVDSGARLDSLVVGQGLRGIDFGFLTVFDKTGLANSGTIIVASTEFVDDVVYGSVSVNNSPSVTVVDPTTGSGSYANGKFLSTDYQAAIVGNVSYLTIGHNSSDVVFLRRVTLTTSAPAIQIAVDSSGVGGGTRNNAAENYSFYTGDSGFNTAWIASAFNASIPSVEIFDTINCVSNVPCILDFDRNPIRLTNRQLIFCTSAVNHSIRATFLYSL